MNSPRIRTVVATALLCFGLGVCAARATTLVQFDSAWWQTLAVSEKLNVVQGMMQMFDQGYLVGLSDGQDEAQKREKNFYEAVFRRYFHGDVFPAAFNNAYYIERKRRLAETLRKADLLTKGISQATSPPIPSFPDTFGTYVHAIDDYYANHPEKTRTVPAYIMMCKAKDILVGRQFPLCD